MVFKRLQQLRRRTKNYVLFGILILVSVCIYRKSYSQERRQQDDVAVEVHMRSNEDKTLVSQAHGRNRLKEIDTALSQMKGHSNPTKNNLSSKLITSSKEIKPGVVLANGTDIGQKILQFFELSSNEEKDEFVNLHDYRFKLNTEICKGDETFLAVVIHSAPRYADRRTLIRTTFGNVLEHRGKRIIYVFVIGDVKGSDDQDELDYESEMNGDIVQGNFFDLYKHLARKHVMSMHWFTHNCNAKYVLKLDDDTFINPYNIVDFILDVNPTGKEMWCKFADFLQPERGKSKWHTSMEEYPFPVFPPFCQGFAYIATRESWLAMYDVSVTNRKISMDDVFVTGILAVKAGIQRYDLSHILWRCHKNHVFIPTGIKRKAILYDPLNTCSKIPFEKWNRLKTKFVNLS